MLPILIQIGQVKIYSYGLCLVLAFLTGTYFLWREARRLDYDEEKIFDFVLSAVLGAFILGRIFFVIFNWTFFKPQIWNIILFWKEPGFHYLGIILGFFGVAVYFLKKQRWPIWDFLDMAVLGLLSAEVIEKMGVFLADPFYGVVADNFFGFKYPDQSVKRLPTALFEALFLVIVFGVFFTFKKKIFEKWKNGALLNLFLIISGVEFLLFSFLKQYKLMWGDYDLTFTLTACIMLVSLAVFYLRQGRSLKQDLSFLKKINPIGDSGIEELIAKTKNLDLKIKEKDAGVKSKKTQE